MPILDEVHDFAHPVEGDSAWSESYYFNAFDPATDTGLFTRIGVRPNEGTMDVGLSVWLPGTELAMVHGVRPQPMYVDYKDLDLLSKLTNRHGRIVSRRMTGCHATSQHAVAKAIKRARFMALLPYVGD